MTQQLDFELHVDHNRYLPEGGRVMDAVISVSASGEGHGPAPTAAEVIMIDCSSSMEGEKIIEARRATSVAVDLLRDDVAFAVVTGNTAARMLYPPNRTMVPASTATRAEAKTAIGGLIANGGTAIGTWLELAHELLAGQRTDIKHGILLTDGHNLHQTPEQLRAILERCRGTFSCESRGVGTGWSAEPLNAIADVLHGTADGLPDAQSLTAEFQAMIEAVLGKIEADVTMQLWHPRGARIRFIKQVFPDLLDLTDSRTPVSDLIGDYSTGAWSAETRDYHLSIEFATPKKLGEEILAAQVTLLVEGQERAGGLVPAIWTDDAALSTKMNQRVAHYSGQQELNIVTQEGLAALAADRKDEATAKLGRAVQLAAESDHKDTLRVLNKLVDVDDAAAGKVRLRNDMAQVDAEMAAVRSRKTVRLRKS